VPNKFNFNLLGNEVACIDCNIRGFVWEMPAEFQQEHFLTHNTTIYVQSDTKIIDHRLMQKVCRKCDTPFNQERRRGRPYLECENCR